MSSYCRSHLTLFISAQICSTDCFTDCYFHRTICKQKIISTNLTVSQYFRPVVNWFQTEKNFGYSKVTFVVLISHFRGMLTVIVRRINFKEEQQVINCCFLAEPVLKFSTEIDIFIKSPKTEFSHYSVESPVQCCPEKANFMQNFCSWYLMERFSEWCITLCTPQVR